ncbi:hypothetical protein GCM10023193_58380 [Planotetraspora kaengkrachanensis]|uniref:Transposase n=1 Tax=Planotetraspora kaengkrachanensis TaxID=575193 RepID=A0A8J3PV45_9ACTN|nr:hypothetical protein Pka01_47420 [Planotetraspora kaengkrachanensis]
MTTKIHLSCEQKVTSLLVTAGQRGDSPQFQPVLEVISVPRMGAGRPRKRPDRGRADRAYGSRANRAYLRRRGIRCTILKKDRPDPPPQEPRQPRRPATSVLRA